MGLNKKKKPRLEKKLNRQVKSSSKSKSLDCKSSKSLKHAAWESTALNYLSKLKNMWRTPSASSRSTIGNRTTSGTKETSKNKFKLFNRDNKKEKVFSDVTKSESNRYSSNKISDTTISCYSKKGERKQKAYNIVSSAIEYGLAKGIVKKDGCFFCLKPNCRTRKPTPMPRKKTNNNKLYDCKACKILAAKILKQQIQPSRKFTMKSCGCPKCKDIFF